MTIRVTLITWAAISAIALLFASHSSAAADELPRLIGVVIKVVDGDTLDVRLDSGPIRVRLHGVDTPERAQPFGKEATDALARLVLNKVVEVEPFEQDGYERLVGIVHRQNLNVNAELVRDGYAWAFRRYMRKSDAELCSFEYSARKSRRGLWKLEAKDRVAPWEYRSRSSRGAFTNYSDATERQCVGQIGRKY